MLRELPEKKPLPGEKKRRWYFCHELDLVVWFDDVENPTGFQLAYNKYRNEHSISWQINEGFRHYVVDEGNLLPGESETPLLYVSGEFSASPVIDQFRSLSIEMPKHIVSFVIEKLLSYPAKP